MMKRWTAVVIMYLVCLTRLVRTGTNAVSIITPSADVAITKAVGDAINEAVVSSNLQKYTWSTVPSDAAFQFDNSTNIYPSLTITNAGTLTAGVYKVIVTAHGYDGSTDVRTFTFTVGSTTTNEHTPVFEALQEPIKIAEWATAGTSVLQVNATDDDTTSPENEISYTIEGTDFTINTTSGLVTLAEAASLDYSTKQKYELVITATDGGSPQNSASITATVTVQTRPIWSDPSPGATLQTSVKETAQNTTIKTLSATDEDDDGSTPLIYNIDSQDPSGTTMFEIIGDTVYTKAGVDLDVDGDGTVSLYKLTLSVSDGENSAKTTVRIDVTVTDENDNTPMFDPDTYDESIPEFALEAKANNEITLYINKGASVLNVSACDDDLSSPNNDITYSLTDTSAFVIDGTTGLITVATPSILNYTAEPVHKFPVTATDDGNPKLTVTVTVTVSLWTRPEWINPAPGETVYKAIAEGPSSSEQIVLLEAEDDDNSGALQYSIVSQDPNTPVMFVVDGASLEQEPGVEFDVDAADATRKYTLKLRVTDGDNTAEADAIIEVSVTDINDFPPVFDPSVYSKTVTEDLTADSSVLIVTATDADFSDANNKIQYTLQDTSVFAINSTTGVIYLGSASALNYDDAPYELVVLATDYGDPTKTASVTATIAVKTKPVWKQPAPDQIINKEIPEDTPFSTLIMTLVAEDKDNSSTPLQYSIHRQDPDTPAVFVIDVDTVKTSPDAQFDVDSSDAVRSFSLYIRVTDGDYTADTDAVIKVTVTDINDSPPVFDPSEYSTTITEDLPADSSVLTVTATDADFSDANNKIQYTLQDSSVFTINSTSGVIYLGSASAVNYDGAPYKLVILATDNGNPSKTASATATIAVETKPVWKQPAPGQIINKEIPEDTPLSTVVMKLVAEDKDNSNTPLQYSIHRQDPDTPAVFVIDVDTVKTSPDAQFDVDSSDAVRSFSLYIRVTDGNYTADTDAVIKVTVTDINDSPPVFDPSEYSTTITEDLPAGNSVLNVTATDADFTEANNEIEYSLEDSTFTIDSTSGIISVKTPSTVNYDDAPYELVVLAKDNGDPTETASVTATIAVETKPEWKDPAPGQSTVKQIREDATDSTVIVTLVAEDKDNSNAPLHYSLISQDPATPVLFVVVGDTVKPAADAQFDVDAPDAVRSYSLSIRVSDGKYTADALLEITVTDVNDSPPSFEQPQYSISIPENKQIGDTVIKVSATDDDYSSPNNFITYSLQADTDVFAVNMSDGRIILVKAPDRLEYTLTMKATDYGTPPNPVEVNVTVQIDADVVDECADVVCLNEGTCQSSVNMFQCNCVDGWSGELCGNNIDDCAGSPCENEGSCMDGINQFTCNCTEGWIGDTCTEVCSNNKFGRNCEMSCQCESAKVETTAVEENQLCDISTGACKCKPTWTGHSCETDVDECENATICAAFENKACGNIDGGYKCGCVRGFIENENNNNKCVTDTDTTEVIVADNETKIDVSFRLNATREFNLHITLDYKLVKTEVEVRILAIMPSVHRVVARSLKRGSLWVNLSLIIQDEEQKKIDTALKVQEIRDGLSFPLFAETVSTQYLLVEETPLPAKDPSDKNQQDVCEVYNAAFGCPSGEECGIVNGEPTCEEIPKDNLPLILGLGLGILLPGILLIILIAIYVHIKYRNKTERTIKSRSYRRRYRDGEHQQRPDTKGYYEDTQEPPYLFYTGDKEINTVSYTSSSIDHVPEGYLYDNKTIPMEW